MHRHGLPEGVFAATAGTGKGVMFTTDDLDFHQHAFGQLGERGAQFVAIRKHVGVAFLWREFTNGGWVQEVNPALGSNHPGADGGLILEPCRPGGRYRAPALDAGILVDAKYVSVVHSPSPLGIELYLCVFQ